MNTIGTKEFAKLLITHAIRSRRWLENAHAAMSPDAFDDTTERPEAVLWSIVSKYWKEHKGAIPKTAMIQELKTYLVEHPGELEDEEVTEMATLVAHAYSVPEGDLAPDYMVKQVQMFLDERIARPQLRIAADTPVERMAEALDESLRRISRTRTSSGSIINSMMPGSEGFTKLDLRPTGLSMIDVLLGGGLPRKTVGGLYGATNGGKTTLAIQTMLSTSLLWTDAATVLMGYEKALDPEYTFKMYSGLLRVPTSRLNRDFKEWPQELKDQLRARLEERKGRLIPVDMVSGGRTVGHGGVPEMEAKLRSIEDNGTEIGLVVVDQVLPKARKFLASHGGKNDDVRSVLQRQVDEYMKCATDHGWTILLIHQWTPEIAGKTPPWIPPKVQDTAECKGWASFMDWSFAIGNMNKDGVGLFANTKSRSSAKDTMIVRFDKQIAEFVYEEGRYELRGKRFIDRNEEGDSYSAKSAEPTKKASYGVPGRGVM